MIRRHSRATERRREFLGAMLIAALAIAHAPVRAATYVWAEPVSGLFKDPSNWLPSNPPGPPGADDSVLFKLNSAPGYVVGISVNEASDHLVINRDRVTLDFIQPGLRYTLGNAGVGVTVGQNNNDVGSLTITRGTLAATDAVVGDASGASGVVHVSGAGAKWSLADDLTVGRLGGGEVDVIGGAELRAANVRVNGAGILTLETGGTLDVGAGVIVQAGLLTRDASSALNLAAGAALSATQSAHIVFSGATTIAAGTRYDISSGSSLRADGPLTVAGGLNVDDATIDAGGHPGADSSAGSFGSLPTTASAGTDGHGVLLLPAGEIALGNGALLGTRGGDGGRGSVVSRGADGGSAGNVEIRGGVATIAGGSTADLRGGSGGSGAVNGGGNGGNGGDLKVTGGTLTLVDGRVLLGAGAGGSSAFATPGSAGATGQVVVSGGQLDLYAGRITTDANAVVTDPIGLIRTTVAVSAGTLNLFDDTTMDGGALTRSAGAVVALAAGKRLTVRNGGQLLFSGPSLIDADETFLLGSHSLFRSLGNVTVVGRMAADDALLDASGQTGSAGSVSERPSPGGGGATVRIESLGSMQLSGTGELVARGGRGGQGNIFFSSAVGGVGGTAAVAGGTVTVSGGAAIDLRGGTGGEGDEGIDTPAGNFGGYSGGNGGRGGRLAVTDGTLSIDGGSVRLDGGAGGVGSRVGVAGAAGSFDMSGGSVVLNHAVISGDAALTSSAPIALLGTTFNLSGGSLDTRAGRLAIGHADLVQSGGTLHASSIELEAGGGYEFSGGTLSVANFIGNLHQTGGTLSPGNSPGLTVVSGDYGLEAPATIRLELAGTARGTGYDALDIGGHFTAGGTLEIALLDGFVPDVGTLFKLFSFGTVSGEFEHIVLPRLPAGLRFDLSGIATKGTLFVMSAPVPLPAPFYLLLTGVALLMRRATRTASALSTG